jgi:hypothetical protein
MSADGKESVRTGEATGTANAGNPPETPAVINLHRWPVNERQSEG